MADSNPDINLPTAFEVFFRPVDNDRLTALFQAVYPLLIVWQSLGDILVPSPDVFFSYIIRKFTPQATTVFFPSDPAFNQRLRFKDGNGTAGTFNIVLNGNGNTIDGSATFVFNINYQFAEVTFNGIEWSVTGSSSGGSSPITDFLTDDSGNILTTDSGDPLTTS